MAVEGLETRAMLDAGGHLDLSFGSLKVPGTGLITTMSPSGVASSGDGTQAVALAANGGIYQAGPFHNAPTTLVPTSFSVGVIGPAGLIMAQPVVSVTEPVVSGMVIEPNGTVDVLATISPMADTFQADLIRFNPNVSTPTTVIVTFGSTSNVTAGGVALEADGKIVIDGTVATGGGQQFGVTRLNTDGTGDTTFGTAGQVTGFFAPGTVQATGSGSGATTLAIQSDGKYVVGGTATDLTGTHFGVARFNTDGTLDTTFATGGMTILNNLGSGVNGLALAPNGDIVLAGGGDASTSISAFKITLEVARLTPTGALDPTFNQTELNPPPVSPGILTTSALSALYNAASAVAVQADGKIVVTTFEAGLNIPVALRYTTSGQLDTTFGNGGMTTLPTVNGVTTLATSLAVQGNGKIVVGESSNAFTVVRLLGGATPGDYTGDGKADPAIYLPTYGSYAIRPSQGGPDQIVRFSPGPGQSIPTPGDYDASGKTEVSVYLPSIAAFDYRPANGGPDVIQQMGIAGAGHSIPAPGDYGGTGTTELAVYLPSSGAYVVRPTGGGPDQVSFIGIAGAGQSIPVPGDYDNSGKTELAVYLPSLGVYIYRPSNGGPDVMTSFGIPGKGNSIAEPGDYDGSGKTELAVYIPALAELVYRPANGGNDVTVSFGVPGAGQTLLAPADYSGDGKTDVAAYFPAYGSFAYRPSGGGADVVTEFGIPGNGQSLPVNAPIGSLPDGLSTTVSAQAVDQVLLNLGEVGPLGKIKKAGSILK